ncbi:uncharacterized protein LOC117123030 isoform X2 [Anneissia japonica]|uniref:uncharacterized protein LOC117123030 isoform X2 n=1 Tax=Anneissia japonica TaxID=1529436 RepID=UPI0014255CD0|nr:uncharacterized protein LOC117123030 isoform X2 [Anneissia japonica]
MLPYYYHFVEVENMMSVKISRYLLLTFVASFSVKHVISRSTSSRSPLSTTLSPDTALTTLQTRNKIENTTFLSEVSSSATSISPLATKLSEKQTITDVNLTVEETLSQQYMSSNLTSPPTQATNNVSDVSTDINIYEHKMNISRSSLTEHVDVQSNNTQSRPSADPTQLQTTSVDLATFLTPQNTTTTITQTITMQILVTNSISTSYFQDDVSSEKVEEMTSAIATIMETDVVTNTDMVDQHTNNIFNMYTTGSESVNVGFKIDLYLPLAVALVILLIWLLLSFFIYILACNRTTSKRSEYSISARGAYSNKVFVNAEAITDDSCYDDNGIEILRTAL